MTVESTELKTHSTAVGIKFKNGDVVTLTSDRIRYLTDPKFSKHVDKWAKEQRDLIGEGIKTLRKELKLSQEACARTAGISLNRLRKVESGETDSNADAIDVALKIFHSQTLTEKDFKKYFNKH